MDLANKLFKAGKIGVIVLVLILVSGNSVAAGMMIKSSPQGKWIADGKTEYRVDIRADSTEIPDIKIFSAMWHFRIPLALNGYLKHTRSTLPDDNNPSQNPADFFYGIFMPYPKWNVLDSTIDASEFRGGFVENIRTSGYTYIDYKPSPGDGSQNRSFENGLLGSYYFIINRNTPPGIYREL